MRKLVFLLYFLFRGLTIGTKSIVLLLLLKLTIEFAPTLSVGSTENNT